MKKLFLFSVATLLSVSLFAQTPEKKMVEFAKTDYDFGTVKEGSGDGGRITAVFKFTNIGTTPIFIESARATCGCTTPQVDSTRPIAPGASGEIPVTYNTIGRPGGFNKMVTIVFKNSAQESSTERVYIRGEVTPKDDGNQPNQQQTVQVAPTPVKSTTVAPAQANDKNAANKNVKEHKHHKEKKEHKAKK